MGFEGMEGVGWVVGWFSRGLGDGEGWIGFEMRLMGIESDG